MTVRDRVALVTGASRGIGLATAGLLARLGARVAICSRHEEAVQKAAREIEQAGGGRVVALVGDVGQEADAQRLVQQTVQELGRLDILVNNAGITRDTLLLRMRDEDWQEVLRVNLEGVFRVTRAALKAMVRQHYGRIVNVTSVAGLIGNPGQANYAAAKAGIVGFTRALARELGSRGITVNAVAPGFITTDMTDVLPEAFKEEVRAHIPAGRFGTPEDVAQAVLFLASPGSSGITAEVLHVDGGFHAVAF